MSIEINDYRNIINTLNEAHGLDMSNFAMTSLKRRIEKAIADNNFRGADELIERIKTDKDFKDIFLNSISVDETEMFRDPSMWREIRDKVLPKITGSGQTRIWIACSTSGDELYSLCILLREAGAGEHAQIIATSISEKNIRFIKKRIYELKKFETNDANYVRFNPDGNLRDYYTVTGSKIVMDQNLLSNVEFLAHNIFTDDPPGNIKLILYRNKMIYFNRSLSGKALSMLDRSLLQGGFLVIGVKEFFDHTAVSGKYVIFNKAESIYKKDK